MNNLIEEGHMDPREQKAVHPAMSPRIIGRGAQRISEGIQLVADRPQMNDQCETQMRVGEAILQARVTRIKEEVNPATRTGGEFRSHNQRATTIKRGIYAMQWLQPLNH